MGGAGASPLNTPMTCGQREGRGSPWIRQCIDPHMNIEYTYKTCVVRRWSPLLVMHDGIIIITPPRKGVLAY